jgi:hypothetical protein
MPRSGNAEKGTSSESHGQVTPAIDKAGSLLKRDALSHDLEAGLFASVSH